MHENDKLYLGCPIQHARQFIAGKWQMGILWNLKDKPLRFGEIKEQLPGISDKILMQELEYFVKKNMIERNTQQVPISKTLYALSTYGKGLLPIITSIVEWGYAHLQDERVHKEMNKTPLSAIEAIENNISKAG